MAEKTGAEQQGNSAATSVITHQSTYTRHCGLMSASSLHNDKEGVMSAASVFKRLDSCP